MDFFEFKIEPNVILDLSNEFTDEYAIINEIIANAYDANASKLDIVIDKKNNLMSFTDNGIGMNEEDISNSFLKISGNKRDNNNYLNISRKIMGRKGSGRIGLFAIANNIKVYSKKNDFNNIGINLNVSEIINGIKKIEKIPVPNEIFSNSKDNGTKIIVSDFFYDSFLEQLNNLGTSIYNNFAPIITKKNNNKNLEKMKINLTIDDKNINIFPDTNNFKLLDRFINIRKFDNKKNIVANSNLEKDNKSSPDYNPNDLENKKERILSDVKQLDLNIKCKIKLKNNKLTEGEIKINSGWIGTYSTIEEKDNINNKNYGVRIYARNRLVIKDIREKFKIDRFYISYVCGELYIDDLDSDVYKDITKLSRDSYGVQDERFQKVVEWTKNYVKILIKEKSKISQKSKNKADNLMSESMKSFLTEAEKKLNLKSDIVAKFSHEAIEKFKIKPADDKKIIFISHVWPENKKGNYANNSYFIGLLLAKTFEELKKIGKINSDVKIIFSAMETFSMPAGQNIHNWLRKEGFNKKYYKNSLFYACIGNGYIKRWNTAIEFGASWFSEESNTISIIDPKYLNELEKGGSLPNPIKSEKYDKWIVHLDKKNKKINFSDIMNSNNKINSDLVEPMLRIGININNSEIKSVFDKIDKENLLYIEYINVMESFEREKKYLQKN